MLFLSREGALTHTYPQSAFHTKSSQPLPGQWIKELEQRRKALVLGALKGKVTFGFYLGFPCITGPRGAMWS